MSLISRPDHDRKESSPAGALNRFQLPARRSSLAGLSLADLSREMIVRLAEGETYASDADLVMAGHLQDLFDPVLDVHLNRFSARRYSDLLQPVLDHIPRSVFAGGTVVDLGSGSLNPFVFGFVFLMLGARRAYAIDLEPPQDLGRATRALATAAGWLLANPAGILGSHAVDPHAVLENLAGFDLARLSVGDPAGIDADRLQHRIESIYDLNIDDGSVDFVSSVSLLEHVDRIDDAVQTLGRITRPGGMGQHVVDFLDHRTYSGEVDRPLAFLDIECDAPLVHGCNRLRCKQVCAKFEAHGFEVDRVETWPVQSLTDAEHRRFSEPFRSMPVADVMPAGARIFVRRR